MSKKKIYIATLAVLLIIATAIVVKLQTSQNPSSTQKDVLEIAKDPVYKNFSIEGLVTQIQGSNITIEATLVRAGKEEKTNKLVKIPTSASILVKTKDGTGFKSETGTIKDIKPGFKLVVYTNTYPYDQAELIPYKVEILK
ncbi:MAG: hypothetical protein KW802_03495 [Candidatus Doudnabacteria bacterium]|nr:hypothetical protein [Candidatus Doudnabacteria bacterium]